MRIPAVLAALLATALLGTGGAAAEKLTKDTTVSTMKGGTDPCGAKMKSACKNEQQTRDLLMQRTGSQPLKAAPSPSGSSDAVGR